MATYRMEDGTVVKTQNATESWTEDTWWNGSNHISRATGSQWSHQRLYRSRRGRYWLEYWSDYEGTTPHAEWVSPQEAARWLLSQDEALPDDLQQYEQDLCE